MRYTAAKPDTQEPVKKQTNKQKKTRTKIKRTLNPYFKKKNWRNVILYRYLIFSDQAISLF